METRQSEEDAIAELLETMAGIVISIEIPVIRMSESERERVNEFFKELGELASFIKHDEDVQEQITLMAGDFLLEREVSAMVLERTSAIIVAVLEFLVDQIEHPDQEEVKKLLDEYLSEDDPTHCVLAQKMLDDIDFASKIVSISKKWIQIETDLVKKTQKEMCDDCSKKDTCESYHI